MDASLVTYDRQGFADGNLVEMTIWRLPHADPERPHGLKYSLFYGGPAGRIVGYDNERGKGDHRHYRDREEIYRFVDVETLVADFLADVRRERGEL